MKRRSLPKGMNKHFEQKLFGLVKFIQRMPQPVYEHCFAKSSFRRPLLQLLTCQYYDITQNRNSIR